jgi:hypothetical protein
LGQKKIQSKETVIEMDIELHPLTDTIAQRVAETEPGPKIQISNALNVLGIERVEAAIAEALKIEASGGEVNAAGDGRHTLGGLFFKKLRLDSTRAEWRQVHKQALAPGLPPLEWADRFGAVEEARAQRGTITNSSLSAVGRPMAVNRQGDGYLVMAVDSNGIMPPLPSYLPQPSSIATTFKVVVGQVQWRKLQGPIRNPENQLVAYGYPIPNHRQKAVVLFALTAGVQAEPGDEETVAVTRVKITVRPGVVVQRGATVVMAFDCSQAPEPVLSEYPDLPQRVVSYVAYASERQWRRIVEGRNEAEQNVSMNGVCFYDGETESLSVLVQNINLTQ